MREGAAVEVVVVGAASSEVEIIDEVEVAEVAKVAEVPGVVAGAVSLVVGAVATVGAGETRGGDHAEHLLGRLSGCRATCSLGIF